VEPLAVIKVGGNVLDHEPALEKFVQDFAGVPGPKILVHGGGKIATSLGEKLGIKPQYHQGRRITDEPTRDLVTMVYGGLVNKSLVARLQAAGCNAIGLSGADANIIPARRRPAAGVDFGWVGDVEVARVDSRRVKQLLDSGLTPVFAPLTREDRYILNTNADTISSALAIACSAHYRVRLTYCFELKGVLADIGDPGSVIRKLDTAMYRQLLNEGKLEGGILPKLENAFEAIRRGVSEVLIGDAADLSANTGPDTEGTLIFA
jgi:acetylglutamate kinase